MKSTSLAFLLSLCVACGTLQTPTTRDVPEADQRSLIQKFERKIAEKLLSEVPAWQHFKTRQDTIDFISAVGRATGSGLNTQLLSLSQQSELQRLEGLATTAEYELNRWQFLNHLSDAQLLSTGEGPDQTLQSLEKNLQYQIEAQQTFSNPSRKSTSYPAPLLEYARQMVRELPTTADSAASVSAQLKQLIGEEEIWLRNRLGLVFSAAEQSVVLKRLLDLQRAHTQREQEFLNKHSISANDYYQNPYYDLMLEQAPKQLILDLIAINLEEALEHFNYREPVSLIGIEKPMASIFYISDIGINLSLPQLLNYPGFELQPIAYRIAGELIARNPWPSAWHEPMGRAIGHWLQQNPSVKGSLESTLGCLAREKTLLILAVAELQIQQGNMTLKDLRRQLLSNTPYSGPQIDGILLDWFASKSSFALTALLADDLIGSKPADIEWLLSTDMPATYSELQSRIERN